MKLHFYMLLVSALIPLLIGFIWYNPKFLGTAWMKEAGLNLDGEKKPNMALMLGVTYVLSCIISLGLAPIVIHQFGFFSMLQKVPGINDPTSEIGIMFATTMEKYGNEFRTFKHGAFHGTITAIVIAMPLFGINALYEMKSFKYVAINVGFWVVCLALMGGLLCATM